MKLKEIAAMSLSQLRTLAPADLKLAYKRTREAALARQKTFQSKGLTTALPKQYRGEIPTAGSFDTPAELRHALKDLSGFLMEDRAYYAGYRSERRSQMEKYNQSRYAKATGIQFESEADFRDFGQFMGEMQERAGQQWAIGSDDAGDIWREAKRLGVDPRQFMKNFEYWRSHIKDLQQAERLNRKELTPAAYRKSMGLEKISSFYDRTGYEKMFNRKRK